MTPETDQSVPSWPARGPFAASYRVMFALAAIWAALAVALWEWGPQHPAMSPALWHAHEMLFGFGGALLAGYLPTACAGWTGRAPLSGWPVAVLAGLWLAARLALWVPVPVALAQVTSAAMFVWLALVLIVEGWRGKGAMRAGFVVFVLAAAALSAGVQGDVIPGRIVPFAVAAFAALLMLVGGRMGAAFLVREAQRQGAVQGHDSTVLGVAAALLVALGVAAQSLGAPLAGGVALILAGSIAAARMIGWPLRQVRRNALLAMLLAGYLWLPLGLIVWGASLIGIAPVAPARALHAVVMGAMGGLGIAVAARASARRGLGGPGGLVARGPAIVAALLIWLGTWARLVEANPVAAGLWIAGWVLFLVAHLASLRGPVPRPIFSAPGTGSAAQPET